MSILDSLGDESSFAATSPEMAKRIAEIIELQKKLVEQKTGRCLRCKQLIPGQE